MPSSVVYAGLAVFFFACIAILVTASQSAQDRQRLVRIERKLDRILAQLVPLDGPEIPPEIRAELLAGNKIKAIKLYREQYSVGLKEAKDAVEHMQETM